ncbi:MAG: nucleotidyl transferase AbiEii/AbiGii toxin family protein [Planctomycetes bacterium]|nr:nucleotidyl transferase AbiEii/AbiGii toxin family protein [Planctomycetota bacterium]
MAEEARELPDPLVRALQELAAAFESLDIRYSLIGGIAAGLRGRPRFTRDLDFILEIPQVALPALLANLKVRGFTFNTELTIKEWTQDHLTELTYHGVRVDWLKPVLPVYLHVLDHSKAEPWLGSQIRVASTEGLIVTKLLAFRTQDQLDIENLLAANRGKLDLDLITREWLTIGAAEDAVFKKFQELVTKYYTATPEDE